MTVLQFSYRKTGAELVRKSQILAVEQALLDLLERNRRGEVVGLWFVADQGDGTHHYSLEGSYDQRPELAYAPICRSMHGLSVIIEEAGMSGCI